MTTLPGAVRAQSGAVETTLQLSINQEPPTLNPLVPGGNSLAVGLIGNAYLGRTLIARPNGTYKPNLVLKVPTVANGGVVVNNDGTMTVTYNIKRKARWSDGNPVTGWDYRFTLRTIMDPAAQANTAIYKHIISDEATRKTYAYTLAAPTLDYLGLFDVVLPAKAVRGSKFLTDWNRSMWPSAGPYVFESWETGGVARIRLVRNDAWWGEPVGFDPIEFLVISELAGEINAFKARETHIFQPNPDMATLDQLRTDPDFQSGPARLKVIAGPVWEHMHFQFSPNNRNGDSANQYRAFRRAVFHAVDRKAIKRAAYGVHGRLFDSPLEVGMETYSGSPWEVYRYNRAKAQRILDKLCDRIGRDCDANPFKMIFSTTKNSDARQAMAAALEPMMEAVGIQFEAQLENSSLFFGDSAPNDTTDVAEWAWLGGPGGAVGEQTLEIFDPNDPGPRGANWYFWGTPESTVRNQFTRRYAELVEAAVDVPDVDSLAPIAVEAEQILADRAIMLPLMRRPLATAWWTDTVEGIKLSPWIGGLTWNIAQWQPVSGSPDTPTDVSADAPGSTPAVLAVPARALSSARRRVRNRQGQDHSEAQSAPVVGISVAEVRPAPPPGTGEPSQIPASTATLDRWWSAVPHSTYETMASAEAKSAVVYSPTSPASAESGPNERSRVAPGAILPEILR